MVGQDVESQKLVYNVISEVYNVKSGFNDARWAVVMDRWGTLALALLTVWHTIDKAVIATAKNAFPNRFTVWSTRPTEGPSIEDLLTPLESHQWDEDASVGAMAARSQVTADSDSDFVLLKRVAVF